MNLYRKVNEVTMKLLTIIVPSYNSQDYLERCIDSLLIKDKRLEILIVNDGSIDQTAKIANNYTLKNPEYIRVIHQQNKGHGGAINTGIKEAAGTYFKVVDSDDWVEQNSLIQILDTIEQLKESKMDVDLIINNYVYERGNKRLNRTVNFTRTFPETKIFKWSDVKQFSVGEVLMMHALTYKTELLRQLNLQLPEHTFYVDNLFVYLPLQEVQTMYYLDVDLYRYFIGREDQSVVEANMIRNIDQQLRVNYLIIQATTWRGGTRPAAEDYLIKHLKIVMGISSSLLNQINSKEAMDNKRRLWQELKDSNEYIYNKINYSLLARVVKTNSRVGIKTSRKLYRIARSLGGY